MQVFFKKSFLHFIIILFPITSFSQVRLDIETKNLSNILSMEYQTFYINTDTFISSENVLYYDGKGNLVFHYEYDYHSDETKHWIKKSDVSHNHFDIYTKGEKDSFFSKKQLNDSTFQTEIFNQESYIQTSIFLNSNTILNLPDSTIVEMKFDSLHNLANAKLTKKNGEIGSIYEYETLDFDKKGNWTKRIETFVSNKDTYKFLKKRKIKYADEYEISTYFELTIDTALLDGQLILDPEILNPSPDGKAIDFDDEEAMKRSDIYNAYQRLFHQKYFNKDYFMVFSTNKKGYTEVLNERLLYYYPAYVFDVANKRNFKGRTKSNRWFDKTEIFNRLEQTESPPSPTENRIQINGYNCREYSKTNLLGKTDKYFVTEELPFINYCDFTFTLPGFVIKSERYIPILGETKLVVDIKKCGYPFHFLEFLKELNEKFGTKIIYLQKSEK